MKKITCSLLAFILSFCLLPRTKAQGFQWAKAIEISNGGIPSSLATDASGNVYTTGSYAGTADFDPGPGTYTLNSSTSSNIYVSKLDASGNFAWARSFVCTSSGSVLCGSNTGTSIKTDPSGNVYISGFFSGSIDFFPGPGVFTLTSTGPFFDFFIVKLDEDGNFVWAKMINVIDVTIFYMNGSPFLEVDATGNVYVTGIFYGNVDFYPGPGTLVMTGPGAYLLKLDTNGDLVWVKQSGTAWPAALGGSIALDPLGNIYTSVGFTTSKLDSNGNLLWNAGAGGYLDVDASGNVYVAGFLFGTMDVDPGPGTYSLTSNGNLDVLIQKLDSSGNFLWARSFGGSDRDRCLDLAVDNSSNVYLIGDYRDTVDFDPGPLTYSSTAIGADAYIVKLDPSWNFGGAALFGSAAENSGAAIDCSSSGGIYSTGYFSNTVDFDQTAGTFTLASTGLSADIFIHKMDNLVGFSENRLDGLSGFYPNPSTGLLTCQVQNNRSYGYVITDVTGKILQEGNVNASSNAMDLGGFAKGLYFITLTGSGQSYTQKVILQ